MGTTVLRTEQECEDFVRGLCFMGTGGGGSPAIGLKLLLDQLEKGREIRWVDLDSLPDEAWTATVGAMGGRAREGGTEQELADLGCVEEKHDSLSLMTAAVQALENSAGIKVEALVPGEVGGSNVPAPIGAALELGLSVVDGDYAGGRAIPEVPQAIPEILGMPVCPMSFVTRWGDIMILQDTVSPAMSDRIGRMITLASYGWIGFAWRLRQAKDIKQSLAGGTLTEALEVGRRIREAREKGLDPVAEAADAVGGWLLFEGEVTSTEEADEQSYGFGVGSHSLKGLGSYEGHTFRIWYKNEYHVSWMDDRPFVTSPDSLEMVDLETAEPRISYDFSVGDRVAIVGRKAHEAHRTAGGIEALGPRHNGFGFDYSPIEDRLREFGAQ